MMVMSASDFQRARLEAEDRLYMRAAIREARAALKARAKEAREEKPKKVVRNARP